jgi:hypothetical protein
MAPRARRGGEIEGLKGRVAEALVEAILQRAGFRVTRVGREGQLPRLVKVGADEFLPDFVVRKPSAAEPLPDRPLLRPIPVEVKYRASVEEFLGRHGDELRARVGERWPDLCVVVVTDHPAAGRSCFQVLDLAPRPPGAPLVSVDLHAVPALDVFPTTVREYEGLVRQIFPLLRLGLGARAS